MIGDWRGQACVIVASGPSATRETIAPAAGIRAIAINESWRLVPWADALYGCDEAWWRQVEGVPAFRGLKITKSPGAAKRYGLHQVELRRKVDKILTDQPGVIGDGGNSGFQAINIAAQAGVSRIVLVGFDMRIDNGVHWHGKHAGGLNNPRAANLPRWRAAIDGAAGELQRLGITVINASATSSLSAYPKMSLKEALGC